MAKHYVVTGIDIGNSAVKTAVAELRNDSPRPQILGVGLSSSEGLRRGVVIDLAQTINDVKNSVIQAENSAGVKVKRAYVSVSGPHIRTQVSRGVIAVSRADNEVSEHDLQRVLEAASTISLPPNREIIHTIPKKFIIDGQEYIKNPLGMIGIRLEADVVIIDALTPYLKSLAKAVNENDIEVAEFVYAPLAAAKAALNKKAREHGALCLDFGGGLCNLAVFEEGELLHTASLPIGSKNITNDLAIAVKTSLDNAEKIKLEHGSLKEAPAGRKENIDLSDITEEEGLVIHRKLIGEVIADRVSEVTEMISRELKNINRANRLAGGVILSGGGVKLPGLVEYIKEKLKLPAKKVSSYDFDGIVNKMDDPSFAVAAGLVLWGVETEFAHPEHGFVELFDSQQALKKLKNWFKIFLP